MTSKLSYEEEILKFWKANNSFEKVQKANKGNVLFNGLEGPPYPTGDCHVGHLRNWAIKDTVFRSKRLQGFDVYYRDGYDVHGLPVESKVQAKLGLQTVDDIKKFGVENFVKECRKYVNEIVDNMKDVREKFGMWLDTNHYQTSHPQYLSLSWRFFKKAEEKNLLYKGYKTVAWSPGAETTLSDYEIKDEYAMLDDPSIYVAFKRENSKNEFFLIWTTTPWTLQSNMAIAMNPELDYARVLVDFNGYEKIFVIANSLIDSVLAALSKEHSIKKKEVLEVVKGKTFENQRYEHVLLEETPAQQEFAKQTHPHIHSIIMADFVTAGPQESTLDKLAKKSTKHSLKEEIGEEQTQEETTTSTEDGTGLVHIAPGHGFDDYEVGKKYDLPIYSPVDAKANITEGKFKGMYFKDADEHIIKYLKEKQLLLQSSVKTHKYPLCWRTKVPIIYRAVEQWWIKRSEIKDAIVKENSNVKWFPEFSKTIFNNLMGQVEDWPISRQRFWGTPLPIFEDEDGNYEVFGSKEELEKRIGYELDDIHLDDLKDITIENKVSKKPMKNVPFTADVWFDSGCASFAAHYNEGLTFEQILEKYYPIKWIIEGQDQIRGWFSSLFTVGYIMTEKRPYNEVLYNQFVMAKDGSKMSKSKGNGFTGLEAIENWGADRTRYYLLTKRAPHDQINFDSDDFSNVESFFTTLENVVRFTQSYFEEYPLKSQPSLSWTSLRIEDKWILFKLNETIQSYLHNINNYSLNVAFKKIEEFLIQDVSKTYLKIIKERVDERDDNLLGCLDNVIRTLLVLFAPAIPFKSEQLYQQISLPNKKETLFLERTPESDKFILKKGEELRIEENFDLAQEVIAGILNAREKASIGVRWPLGEVSILSSNENIKNSLNPFEKLIKTLTNIAKIKYGAEDVKLNYVVKPAFKQLKEDFNNPADAIKAINLNKYYIGNDLASGLTYGTYDGVKLDFERHILKEIELEGELVSSDFSQGSLILHTHQDEILLEQGYLRELIRRVQLMRKEQGLDKKELIKLSFENSDSYFHELVGHWEGVIKKKVGAEDILQKSVGTSKEFKIKDKKLIISISKL